MTIAYKSSSEIVLRENTAALRKKMGNSFRAQPLPSQYPPNRTPVTEDVLQIGLIYAVVIVAVSFILIIPGIRSWEVCHYLLRQ